MAMSSMERTRNHRIRKQAAEFANAYLDGAQSSTPEDFEAAMKWQFESENYVVLAGFDQGFLNRFYEATKDLPEVDDDTFLVTDLYAAWLEAGEEEVA
jgi:hypothetical protein